MSKNIKFWDRNLPNGVNKRDHYNSLSNVIDECLENCSEDVVIIMPSCNVPIFAFIDNFKYAERDNINGEYLLGYYKDIPAYVSPAVEDSFGIALLNKKKCHKIYIKQLK